MVHFSQKFASRFFGISMLLVLITSCNKNASESSLQTTCGDSVAVSGLRLAYVDVDSLMKQYDFCIDYAQILQKKTETIQNTLNSKGLSLQKEIAEFQSKMEQGAYTREQAESAQEGLQKKQLQLQNLQQSLAAEFDKQQNEFNEALRDSLHNFLAIYNKGNKYNFIISKAGDNILLADEKLDITEDVVKGLNKCYQRPEEIRKALQKK